jgi:hypothetical protein
MNKFIEVINLVPNELYQKTMNNNYVGLNWGKKISLHTRIINKLFYLIGITK